MTTMDGVERVSERHLPINLCNLPPWVIASAEFNINPVPVQLAGVRESNRRIFNRQDAMDKAGERGQVFHDYLDVKFALHQWSTHTGKARSSLRNSYLRFLCGWGVDSNGVEGAVLKSWVQSRFGVMPTYHRGILQHVDGDEDQRYAIDRMKGHSRGNAIFSQLDLLYEFCQYEIGRRWSGCATVQLFRGTNDPEEHPVRMPLTLESAGGE